MNAAKLFVIPRMNGETKIGEKQNKKSDASKKRKPRKQENINAIGKRATVKRRAGCGWKRSEDDEEGARSGLGRDPD